MKIYCDIDDTLVTWLDGEDTPLSGQNPYGGGAQNWRFNDDLINCIINFSFAENVAVVLWSGGGIEYAQHWLNRLENHLNDPLLNWVAIGKSKESIALSSHEDMAIDDMADSIKGFNGRIMFPESFMKYMDA